MRTTAGLAAVALVGMLWTAGAWAHEPGSGSETGFVATVAAVRPNVVGVEARIVLGDELHVSNLTRTPLEILDRAGDPFVRIPPGASRAWHDPRVVGRGDPPPPAPGTPEGAPRFVKNWTIPGRAAGRKFAIEGFLGWVPPEESGRSASWLWFAAGALTLTVLSGVAAYLLGRGRA
jgi:hypothetical protein